MTQNATLAGDKIYEMDLDLTGVADFGVSMGAIITGKEARSHCRAPGLTLPSTAALKAASLGGCTASTICGCEPIVAWSSTCT
jgi:hypothetical protein